MAGELFQWKSAKPSKRGWLSAAIGLAGLGGLAALISYGGPYLSSPRSVNPPKETVEKRRGDDPIARVLRGAAPKTTAISTNPPAASAKLATPPAPAARPAGPAPSVTVLNEKPEEQKAAPESSAARPAQIDEKKDRAAAAENEAVAPASEPPLPKKEQTSVRTEGNPPRDASRPRDVSQPRRTALRSVESPSPRSRAPHGNQNKDFRSLRESVLREALGSGR